MAHQLKDKPKQYRKKSNKRAQETEANKPEKSAEAIDIMTDPFAKMKEAAQACGFPANTLNAIIRRMETRYQPVNAEIKKIKTPQILSMIEEKIYMCLDHMDDVTFANAELRDLAVAFGILTEKRQLLRGEPTQILSVNERTHMNDLIPLIVKEATRRGMTIDATPGNASDEAGVETRVLPRQESSNNDVISRGQRKLINRSHE